MNRPRKSKSGEERKVYSVRLEPSLAARAVKKAGGLTRAIEEALRAWLMDSKDRPK